MKFKDYLKTYFWDIVSKHYFDFNGREGRKVFWLYVLNTFILNMVVSSISLNLGYIIGIALLLPGLSLSARRLHDVNFSAWWLLLSFIPIFNIALLILACLPGTAGDNNYGPAVSSVKTETTGA